MKNYAQLLLAATFAATLPPAMAQNSPTIPAIGSSFLTPEDLAKMGPQNPASKTAAATTGAGAATPVPTDAQKAKMEKLIAAQNALNAQAGNAQQNPAKPQTATPSSPQNTANSGPVQPSVAPVSAKPAFQRYIPETETNNARIDYYESVGAEKANSYAKKYSSKSPVPAPASGNPSQVKLLEPIVAKLRDMGVEQSKIDLELNRLTPAQFVRWATEIQN